MIEKPCLQEINVVKVWQDDWFDGSRHIFGKPIIWNTFTEGELESVTPVGKSPYTIVIKEKREFWPLSTNADGVGGVLVGPARMLERNIHIDYIRGVQPKRLGQVKFVGLTDKGRTFDVRYADGWIRVHDVTVSKANKYAYSVMSRMYGLLPFATIDEIGKALGYAEHYWAYNNPWNLEDMLTRFSDNPDIRPRISYLREAAVTKVTNDLAGFSVHVKPLPVINIEDIKNGKFDIAKYEEGMNFDEFVWRRDETIRISYGTNFVQPVLVWLEPIPKDTFISRVKHWFGCPQSAIEVL